MPDIGDARIQDLPEVNTIYGNDHFFMEQLGRAVRVDGRTFKESLRGEKGNTGLTGPQGVPGMNAVVSELADGVFAMEIDPAGELILKTNDQTPAPPLSLDPATGSLIYTVGGA